VHLRRIGHLLAVPAPAAGKSHTRKAPQRRAPRDRTGRQTGGPPAIPSGYLKWLQERTADVDLLGLKMQQGQTVKLNNVYVPLTTNVEQRQQDAGHDGLPMAERPVQLLLDLLDRHSLYVSGRPGCGKSTFWPLGRVAGLRRHDAGRAPGATG